MCVNAFLMLVLLLGPPAQPVAPEASAVDSAAALAAQKAQLDAAEELLERGDAAGAEAAFKRLLEANPGHREVTLGLGRAYLAEQKYQLALNTFNGLLAVNDRDFQAVLGRARSLLGLGDGPKALEWSKKGMELNPDDIAAYKLLGDTYLHESVQDYPRAEATFRQAIAHAPADRLARLGLVKALSYQKKVKPAIELLEALAQEKPEDLAVQLKLAEATFSSDDLGRAMAVLEKILAVVPDHPEALRLREAVLSRRSFKIWLPIAAGILLPVIWFVFKRLRRGRVVREESA